MHQASVIISSAKGVNRRSGVLVKISLRPRANVCIEYSDVRVSIRARLLVEKTDSMANFMSNNSLGPASWGEKNVLQSANSSNIWGTSGTRFEPDVSRFPCSLFKLNARFWAPFLHSSCNGGHSTRVPTKTWIDHIMDNSFRPQLGFHCCSFTGSIDIFFFFCSPYLLFWKDHIAFKQIGVSRTPVFCNVVYYRPLVCYPCSWIGKTHRVYNWTKFLRSSLLLYKTTLLHG